MSSAAAYDSPVVTATLAATAHVTGMEAVFVGNILASTYVFRRFRGSWSELGEGRTLPTRDAFCTRMLAGAPNSTADAGSDPWYADSPLSSRYGVRSYVGVPIPGLGGAPLGTLCGIDHDAVPVDDDGLTLLRHLAAVVSAHVLLPEQPLDGTLTIRRTSSGWRIDGAAESDSDAQLANAIVLADLLAEGLEPSRRPARAADELDEVGRLRLAVAQLEHALSARVAVEQAIGVLVERQRLAPRAAFERLRKAARSRGRRVHHLAREVVASAHGRGVPLPPELAGHR